ncbi:PfkB family carbohydrate kinase [Tundrisphaera sp. TA3]|uniref:PfkB family carbohydrate kinase n=1 Tax=Tundrisphaera sp. TA3 TaxID=3435775 RepID=UPI003EBE70CF
MPRTSPRTLVFGPAYLDRVLRVDIPLVDPSRGEPPLDGSVDGAWAEPGDGLTLRDPAGGQITVELPADWPGPTGTIALGRPLSSVQGDWTREVIGRSWGDDLGGMGAGYASALGGTLIHALGPEADPVGRSIEGLLASSGITHRPIRVAGHGADWTLLISGGATGDKLPIGFRGCHAAVDSLGSWKDEPCEVRVAAALPNRLIAEALAGPAEVRVFAPSLRNMLDRDPPVLAFADHVDLLACNRAEWESLDDREQVAWRIPVLVVTDGADGATVRFTTPEGEAGRVRVPTFPRDRPPRDTNRAGEAFASTFLLHLRDHGWTPGVAEIDLMREATARASAASALVIDREGFGFPSGDEIDAALRAGRVD